MLLAPPSGHITLKHSAPSPNCGYKPLEAHLAYLSVMADFLARETWPRQTGTLTLKGGENGLSAFSIMLKVVREKDNFQLSSALATPKGDVGSIWISLNFALLHNWH